MAIAQEIQQTLDLLKTVYSDGPQALSPDVAKALNVASGLQAYNLEAPAKVLVPIFSPIRNKLPRKQGKGKAVEFKAITEVDTSGQSGVATEGQLAAAIATGLADVTISYRPWGLSSDPVTFEAQWAGQGYQDVKETAIANLLKAVMRAEEKLILFGQGAAGQITATGGQSYTLGGLVGASPAPTVAAIAAPSGTSPNTAATTYYVVQTVVTGMGESLPSTATAVTTTAGQAIQITPTYPAGIPALGFNFYIGTASGGPFYKVIVADLYIQNSGQTQLGNNAWITNGQLVQVVTLPIAANGQPPAIDASGNTQAFNGLFSYLFATGSGAQITKQKGELTSLNPIDSLFEALWDNSAADPSDVYCNSYESKTITKLVLGAGSTPYFLTVDNQQSATANYRVARYVNPITGRDVAINVHKYIPQGNILALSADLPEWYPSAGVSAPFEMDLVTDYTQIDYPPTAANPQWISEIRCFGALKGYIPSIHGAIVGISM